MPILKYLLGRLLTAIPLVFGLVTLVFFLSRLLPGDVTNALVSPTIPESVRQELRSQLGLDRPILDQYIIWFKSVLAGDLGTSFSMNTQVVEVIKEVLPNTLVLGAAALMIEVVLGVCLAVPAFLFAGRWFDKVLGNVLLVVYSLPSFWIGIMLLVVLSYGMGVFPSSQMYSSGSLGTLPDLLHHLILPACTAAIPAAAGLARYLRSTISTVMQQDYVHYAQSMGLSRRSIFRFYVLPNSITPFVSLIGIEIGILLSGVLVTEMLFSWPGMGQLTVKAITSRDYPLVLGCAMVSGLMVIAGNLMSDILNALFDPRIRVAE